MITLGQWTEPNNHGGDEDCSMMFSWGHESNGKWADVGCDATVILNRRLIPLCERDKGVSSSLFQNLLYFCLR